MRARARAGETSGAMGTVATACGSAAVDHTTRINSRNQEDSLVIWSGSEDPNGARQCLRRVRPLADRSENIKNAFEQSQLRTGHPGTRPRSTNLTILVCLLFTVRSEAKRRGRQDDETRSQNSQNSVDHFQNNRSGNIGSAFSSPPGGRLGTLRRRHRRSERPVGPPYTNSVRPDEI